VVLGAGLPLYTRSIDTELLQRYSRPFRTPPLPIIRGGIHLPLGGVGVLGLGYATLQTSTTHLPRTRVNKELLGRPLTLAVISTESY
jgi:hypothetical protein